MEETVEISVIIPVTERYDDVRALYADYKKAISGCNCAYEFVYVLDGNYSAMLETLKALQEGKEPIKIVVLSKEFGEATALNAGFENSAGKYIVTLPAYYQVKPDGLSTIVGQLADYDMVVCRRWPRMDSPLNKVQTRIFSWLVKRLTGTSFNDLGCGVRAFKRQVIDEVNLYGDQHRFLPILADRYGFSIKEIDITQSEKDKYRRVYKLGVYPRRLLDLLTVFFLIKFTKKPLRFFGLIGAATFGIGGIFLLVIVLERLIFGTPLTERPAMFLSSLLVVLGVQIFALGLLGELIIFTHARELKEYTVEKIIN